MADMGEYCFHRFLGISGACMRRHAVCTRLSFNFCTCLFENLGTRLSIIGRHRRGEGGGKWGGAEVKFPQQSSLIIILLWLSNIQEVDTGLECVLCM